MKTTNNANGNTVKEEEKKDDRYTVYIKEPDEFESTMDTNLLKSTGLCDIANEIFSNSYLDYEGSTFEIVYGTNKPMICLFFNHRDYSSLIDGKGNVVACSKNIDDNKEGNITIKTLRNISRRQIEGDRFYMTKEGKEGIGDFLFDYNELRSIYYNTLGKWNPNWSKITADVADPNNRYWSPVDNQQYTKVSFIDPVKIVMAAFGRENELTGEKWEYGVRIVSSLPGINNFTRGNNADNNFLLAIERYSENKIYSLARELNLSVPSGLNIHR